MFHTPGPKETTANAVIYSYSIVVLKLDGNNENTFTSFSRTLLLDNCNTVSLLDLLKKPQQNVANVPPSPLFMKCWLTLATCATAKQIPDYKNGDDGPECTVARLTYYILYMPERRLPTSLACWMQSSQSLLFSHVDNCVFVAYAQHSKEMLLVFMGEMLLCKACRKKTSLGNLVLCIVSK